MGILFCPFRTKFLEKDDRHGCVDGCGGSGCCGEGCGCGASGSSRVLCLFLIWLFEEYDGCESGDGGCGWCGGVGVVELV